MSEACPEVWLADVLYPRERVDSRVRFGTRESGSLHYPVCREDNPANFQLCGVAALHYESGTPSRCSAQVCRCVVSALDCLVGFSRSRIARQNQVNADVCLYYGEALGRYGFPHGHPLGVDRQGALQGGGGAEVGPAGGDLRTAVASRAQIERFHNLAMPRTSCERKPMGASI